MALSASFRVPYWPFFATTAALTPLGLVLACLWLDERARLTTTGTGIAVVVVQLLLLVIVSAWVVGRFQYLTLFRLELDDGVINGRSVLKAWCLPLSEVEAIVPGWRTSWLRSDHNRYVVRRATGGDLFIWCGKGLTEFLRCVGSVQPRLAPNEEDGTSRVERARGRSGFRTGPVSPATGQVTGPCEDRTTSKDVPAVLG